MVGQAPSFRASAARLRSPPPSNGRYFQSPARSRVVRPAAAAVPAAKAAPSANADAMRFMAAQTTRGARKRFPRRGIWGKYAPFEGDRSHVYQEPAGAGEARVR